MAKNKIVGKNKRKKSNLATGRDYSYDKKYESSKKQIANRASRNKARSTVIKSKGKAAVRGKDVDHKDSNPRNNSKKNLRVVSKKKNRGRKK